MGKKQTYIVLVIALFLIAGAIFWGMKQPETANAPSVNECDPAADVIYYYGETCPHCKDVTKFLEDNKIAEKVNFCKKEVWNNKDNNAEMEKKAAECKIEKSGMGVPFLYARGMCYVGTPDVEAFFKQEAGI